MTVSSGTGAPAAASQAGADDRRPLASTTRAAAMVAAGPSVPARRERTSTPATRPSRTTSPHTSRPERTSTWGDSIDAVADRPLGQLAARPTTRRGGRRPGGGGSTRPATATGGSVGRRTAVAPAAAHLGAAPGQQPFERGQPPGLEEVHVAALRDAGPGPGQLGQVVPLDDRHPLDVAGQGLPAARPATPAPMTTAWARPAAAARRSGRAAADIVGSPVRRQDVTGGSPAPQGGAAVAGGSGSPPRAGGGGQDPGAARAHQRRRLGQQRHHVEERGVDHRVRQLPPPPPGRGSAGITRSADGDRAALGPGSGRSSPVATIQAPALALATAFCARRARPRRRRRAGQVVAPAHRSSASAVSAAALMPWP